MVVLKQTQSKHPLPTAGCPVAIYQDPKHVPSLSQAPGLPGSGREVEVPPGTAGAGGRERPHHGAPLCSARVHVRVPDGLAPLGTDGQRSHTERGRERRAGAGPGPGSPVPAPSTTAMARMPTPTATPSLMRSLGRAKHTWRQGTRWILSGRHRGEIAKHRPRTDTAPRQAPDQGSLCGKIGLCVSGCRESVSSAC